MGAITGNEYIDRIDSLESNIWIEGKSIQGKISEHPAFKGVLRSQANLYDLQHEEFLEKIMTYISPTSQKKVGTSYMLPRTTDDLIKRRKMIQEWAKANAGMMGRSPDYMNTVLMSLVASIHLFKDQPNCFPNRLLSFYDKARENDYSFTHTFINPQVNRAQFYFDELNNDNIAAKVVEKNAKGLVINGARLLATQGGITDELLILPAGNNIDKSFAYAFSIPSNTKGLKFVCRESFVNGDSNFDYPLSANFEEMDTIVLFDNVLVPWERVFFYDNMELAQKIKTESDFLPLTLHQVLSRQIIKSEFILGVAQSIVDTINIGEYQHVQEKVSEIIVGVETLKALLVTSEVQAKKNQSGVLIPDKTPLFVAINTFPNLYPRFAEIIQLLGSSGLVSIPTEKDFNSEIKNDLDFYLQSATKKGNERVQLFRLAWDMCMSSFGTRQTLYERFFFGDPIRLSSTLYKTYRKDEYIKRIEDFLSLHKKNID